MGMVEEAARAAMFGAMLAWPVALLLAAAWTYGRGAVRSLVSLSLAFAGASLWSITGVVAMVGAAWQEGIAGWLTLYAFLWVTALAIIGGCIVLTHDRTA